MLRAPGEMASRVLVYAALEWLTYIALTDVFMGIVSLFTGDLPIQAWAVLGLYAFMICTAVTR